MELVTELVNNQLALIPIAAVIVLAVLVYACGFKSTVQPPFDKISSISSEDRKQGGKKKKPKEKKSTANGHIANSVQNKTEKSPAKQQKKSPAKETAEPQVKKQEIKKETEKNKKNEVKSKEAVVEVKSKKSKSKVVHEKPVDYDDGNWEKVMTKADKKKKQDGSPAKKDKKKPAEKSSVEIEKYTKDNHFLGVLFKEVREKEIMKPKPEPAPVIDEVIEVVEKKEKVVKKEKKVESKPIVEPVVEQIAEAMNEQPAEKVEGTVVIDELGDVWTEAKVPKKGKKKARRDN